MTSDTGTVVETTDYRPFGKVSNHTQAGTFSERRKYTSHDLDTATEYTYAKARYLKTNLGRFLSEDPAFLALGNNNLLENKTGVSLEIYLSDPQLHNSYGYARNNPIKFVDPTGEFIFLAPLLIYGVPALAAAATFVATNPQFATILTNAFVNRPVETSVRTTPFVGDVIDAKEAISGINTFTGESLSTGERMLSGVSAALPFVSAGVMRAGGGWGNPGTLQRHFRDHGADFGVRTAEEYAQRAQDFSAHVLKGNQKGAQSFVSPRDGKTYVYDSSSNTYGVYNSNGSTATFYKPGNPNTYWQNKIKEHDPASIKNY